MYVFVWSACVPECQRSGWVSASYHILPYFWKQNLSLNLKLSVELEMAEQWVSCPSIHPTLPYPVLVTGAYCYVWLSVVARDWTQVLVYIPSIFPLSHLSNSLKLFLTMVVRSTKKRIFVFKNYLFNFCLHEMKISLCLLPRLASDLSSCLSLLSIWIKGVSFLSRIVE